MIVRVRLFAVARQLAGRESIDLEVSQEATIAEVRRRLAAEVPEMAALADRMRFSVGTDYASDDTRVSGDSDIACIPPVSGG